MRRFAFLLVVLFVALSLASFVVWPELDLVVSGWFADGENGFLLRRDVFLNALGKTAFYGARALAAAFALLGLFLWLKNKKTGAKAAFFLLLCLLIGPGLLANVVFKDHWGRARPREVSVFGGKKEFTPVFVIGKDCKRNCSFVSGDAAFGFFFPSFAYVATRRRRGLFFWTGMGVGVVFGFARIFLGAHFPSDVLSAAVLVMAASAGLHALFYGAKETASFWRERAGLETRRF